MSEGQKKKDELKNTDLWKQKQDQKKKKKQQQDKQAPSVKVIEETLIKDKEEPAAKIGKKKEKKENGNAKIQEISTTVTTIEQKKEQVMTVKAIEYKTLKKIDSYLLGKDRLLNREHQQQLITKYMDQYINSSDTIIYLSNNKWNCACDQIYLYKFNNATQAELVCRYADIAYFIESTVTKVFCEADYLFANGSILTKKGSLNVILLALEYKLPVVCCSASWNYNGWAPISEKALQEKYGEGVLNQYDWIQPQFISIIIMEVGAVSRKQVSQYPSLIYKNLNTDQIEW